MADATLTEEPPAPAARLQRPRLSTTELLLRVHAALLGGVLAFLAFPPVGAWPLAPIGACVVLLATYRQRARFGALLGFLAGLGLFVPLFTWVRVVGIDAWIGLAVVQAAYLALLGAGLALVTRLPGWPVWSATLWVAQEALRGRFPFGGFTWGDLAFSQGNSPFTPYASLAGAPFVTFLVALTGGLLAYAALHAAKLWRSESARAFRPAVPAGPAGPAGPASRAGSAAGRGVAAVAATLVCVLAIPALGFTVPLPTGGKPVTVAAVQGNVAHSGMQAVRGNPPEAVLGNHAEATHQLAAKVAAGGAPQPDFVVWPETASLFRTYESEYARTVIDSAVDDVSVPVLVGANVGEPGTQRLRNVGIVWSPETGPGDAYTKRHLVPFGEYIPFRDFMLRYFERLEMVGKDLIPGTKPGALEIAGTTVANAICFDVAYHDVVREAVVGGGKLITVQTNNNTYLHSAQPEQQLAIERLRAVEHGRAVVVAAISGISAIIGPDGDLLEVSKPSTQDVLLAQVPLRSDLTLSDRLGAAPEWALAGAGLLAVVAAVLLPAYARRRRR